VIIGTNDRATGVVLSDCSNVILKNNIFKTVGKAIRLYSKCDSGLDSDFNVFYSGAETPFGAETEGGYGTFAEWQSVVGQDPNSVFADPLFVDENAGTPEGYSLSPDSPAIDAGVDVGLIQDFDGNPITSGIPDIGVFEFQEVQSSCGEADRNTDGVIDISEIISYVGKWRNGQVSLQDVMAAIIVWKT